MADSYHMTPDEFRRHGHALIDWIAAYMEEVESLPIVPSVTPGDVVRALPRSAPEQPEDFSAILADLDTVVKPALTHWQSPGWFGYFPANTSGPGILGDLASSGLGQQGMLWLTSPACTEVEMVMMDWLVDLMGLPQTWKMDGPGGGVIQMSASDSTHTALAVARIAATGQDPAADVVAYTSSQAHSSTEKGARIAGYRHLRLIDVDKEFAMVPEALEQAIEADLSAGLTPAYVTSTVGTTGTTAVDPVRAIAGIACRHRLWHHVDAAYAGTAMILPELRHHQDGLELVDSYTFNPHKWMFTNFDCSAFYVADRKPLIEAMSILPPYLRNTASDTGEVVDYRDWHVPLGRRFRALKLWFVLRSYGAEGIRHHVRRHIELASGLRARLEADDRFVVAAPSPFALVCFRLAAGSAATDALAEHINASGKAYVTASKLDGESIIRVSVGQTHTEQRHVDALWALIDTV